MSMWIGSAVHGGSHFADEEIERFPAIVGLAKKFGDFQNSPYRGEWKQRASINFGEIRDILAEVSRLMKNQKPVATEEEDDES